MDAGENSDDELKGLKKTAAYHVLKKLYEIRRGLCKIFKL